MENPTNKSIALRARGVIVDEGSLLVVRHNHGAHHYVLPGGHLDWGEDPQECLTRELTEELGIPPVVGRLLFIHTFFTDENTQTIEFIFEVLNGAAYHANQNEDASHAHEIVEQRWVSKNEQITLLPTAVQDAHNLDTLLKDTVQFVTHPIPTL